MRRAGKRLDVDGVRHEPACAVVQDDLARLCSACETGGGAGNCTDRRRGSGGDDLTRSDPDARLELVTLQHLAEIDRGPYRAEGIVFVQRRQAERRRDGVSTPLGHDALVVVDYLEYPLLRSFQHPGKRFRIRHIGARGAEVHVHDRDRFAHDSLDGDSMR